MQLLRPSPSAIIIYHHIAFFLIHAFSTGPAWELAPVTPVASNMSLVQFLCRVVRVLLLVSARELHVAGVCQRCEKWPAAVARPSPGQLTSATRADNPDGPIRSMQVTQALAALAALASPISESPRPGPVPEARLGAGTPSLNSRLRQRPAHDERSSRCNYPLGPVTSQHFLHDACYV